jgi:hypothetical protein
LQGFLLELDEAEIATESGPSVHLRLTSDLNAKSAGD